jgi:5,10-methenyltetrahydrofolate synthetase
MSFKTSIRQIFKNINLKPKYSFKKNYDNELIIDNMKRFNFKNKTIGIYNPLIGEPNVISIIEKCPINNYAFPKITDKTNKIMKYIDITNNKEINDIDVFIIPGLAFDKFGTRLGYGSGYFDRYLHSNFKSFKIGVCYDENFSVSPLPREKHDVQMDLIITPSGIHFPQK